MATNQETTNYVTTQTHPIWDLKQGIWRQISDSYSGGITYRDGDYLHKFALRESSQSYTERQKRAIYFNNVEPLADLLMGFLYMNQVIRSDYKQDDLILKATRTETLDMFMQKVALNSLLYTTGVLVDSPTFDARQIQTEADRKAAGLNPYCIMYHPWQIRNYYCDENNILQWVLLDNTYYDNSDPYKQAQYVTQYRLWTKEYYQDFTSVSGSEGIPNISTGSSIRALTTGSSFEASEQFPHPLEEVPFIFVNWKTRTDDKFQDTIFEDIALFDQAIYNYMSLSDEMLAGGTFKFLVFPGQVPDEIKSEGFSNLAVIPYSDAAVHEPKFIGPTLSEVDPFLKYIEFLLVGILRKLGLNTDAEKNYVQSGAAKVFDFTKTRAFLASGAETMENTEKEIFRLSGKWLNVDDDDVKVEYQKDFLGVEAETEMERMLTLLSMPVDKIQEQAMKRMVELSFNNTLSDEEVKEINQAIEDEAEESQETKTAGRINIQALAEAQKQDDEKLNNKESKSNDRTNTE